MNPPRKTVVIGAALVVVGAVGFLVAHRYERTKAPAGVTAGKQFPEDEIAPGGAKKMATGRMPPVAATQKAANVRMPVFTNEGKLSDGFIRSIDATEAEARILRTAIEHAHAVIDQLSLTHASVDRKAGLLGIKVAPFEEGADIYDRLMGTFEKVLGNERYAAMVDIYTDELQGSFNHFGAEIRMIVITPSLYGGKNLVDIRDYGKTPTADTSRETTSVDLSHLPDSYRWLAPLVSQGSETQPPSNLKPR